MGFGSWIAQNWFVLLQSLGIIGGLLFTAVSFRIETKARRITNLISMAEQHREIWKEFYRRPELARVLESGLDFGEKSVITEEEELFVLLLILHLNTAYHAMKDGVFSGPEGLRRDIRQFFSLPIPKAVWEKVKTAQDQDFVRFAEECMREGQSS